MRKHRNAIKGDARVRETIVKEAAKLMYSEGVGQYHTAKWRAAKSVLSQGGNRVKTIRPRDLPSNGEISDAVYAMAKLFEGDALTSRLFEIRIAALDIMEQLEDFSPRLIGSVSTGRIKKTSDIDLHLFTDNLEPLETRLNELGWHYAKEEIHILYNGKPRQFTHIYLDTEFPIELSIYPNNEIRVQGRSSTDGKPIIRMSYNRLLALIQEEHSEDWEHYLSHS